MSLVQQVGFDAQANNSQAVTIASSTAGNTLLVIMAGGSTGAVSVPTDNLSTTWPTATIAPMSNSFLTAWLLQNCPAGITAITVHMTGGGQGWIVEESGLLAGSLDKTHSQSSSGTTVTSGNTTTLSQAAEVCYGIFGHDSNTQFSAGSGWSAAAFTNYGGSGGGGYTAGNQGNTLLGNNTFIERQVVSATTALAATATITSSTVDAAIITLAQTAGLAAGTLTLSGAVSVLGTGITPLTAKMRHFEREQAKLRDKCREAVRSIFLPGFGGLVRPGLVRG